MERTTIKTALDNEALSGTTVTVAGWVRTFRNDRFIALNDGSTIRNLQCVIDQEQVDAATRARFTTSAAVKCTGELVASQGSGQRVEMKVTAVTVLGDSDATAYPIQPKKHSLEFLRENAHLRFRTNTYSAVFRMRHQVSFGIHEYFDKEGYNYFHSPIITASDAEGAGEMFRVSTLDAKNPPVKLDLRPELSRALDSARSQYWELLEGVVRHESAEQKLSPITINEIVEDLKRTVSQEEPSLSQKVGMKSPVRTLTEFEMKILDPVWQSLTNSQVFRDLVATVRDVATQHHSIVDVSVGTDHLKSYSWHNSPLLAFSFGALFKFTQVDFSLDFFGAESRLTVSGQLQAELSALALGKVYTFGPTFRAENSNTTRHLAEFWMIEPEAAFMDLKGDMDLAEGLCKHLIARVLKNSMDDLQFLDTRLKEEEATKPQAQRSEMGLIERLQFVLDNPFERITYDEAINILLRSKPYQKKQFQFPVEWGVDLQSEHERYLVEKHFKKPVIVTGYPAQIKAFYMRTNDPGDLGYSEKGKTVAAMDVLFPGIGEIIGGSQREERLEVLEARMKDMNVPAEELWWYLDTRKYGTVPHAGFGLGLERFVLFVTGMGNIRDVIPFPRTPGSAEF